MYGEIYIDLVFVANLLLDYFLLRLTGLFLKCRTGRIRCFLAALLGALTSCLAVCVQESWMTFVLHGVCAVGMLRIGCGLKKKGLFIQGVIALYFAAFLWGGFWEALFEKKSTVPKTFFLSALGTYLGLSALLYISDSVRMNRKNIYPITLTHQRKIHRAYGFYDTGNLLTDPYSGEPVSIIGMGDLGEILSKEMLNNLKNITEKQGELESTEFAELHPRLIPYRTVGQEQGVMLAITLEKLCIHTPGAVIYVPNPVFGLIQSPSALGKEYEVLLNSRLMKQGEN